MSEHETRHYVDAETPLYEETIRATGIVPDPPAAVVVVVAPGVRPIETVGDIELYHEPVELPARPAGAAAVVAISEPTATLPRPHKSRKARKK